MRRLSVKTVLPVLLIVWLSACALTRPTPPPEGAPVGQAWGSVPLKTSESPIDNAFADSLINSLRARFEREKQVHGAGKVPYRALTISGGGSRGAYGVGVLSGWTARGDRPQFDIVTGVSAGALMATHAFLGAEFDDELARIKRLTNDDVYRRRGIIGALRAAAAFDTTPLRASLRLFITEEILDLVAAEHRKGRRLFVGTTNLDANLFTIWDMGVIAESSRPDRLQRYVDVIMASTAFPLVFPPVYIEVEGEAGAYTQMHADGSIRETVFYFDFIDELDRAVEAAGLSLSDFKQELYLLNNAQLDATRPKNYKPVEGKITSIAGATVESLMTKVTQGSVYRLWVLAMANGADFHLSFVPADFEFTSDTLTFDPEEQTALYELGYQQALDGTAWATQLAPASAEQLLELIVDPASKFDLHEPMPWMMRGEK